jgi:hypothetical protein
MNAIDLLNLRKAIIEGDARKTVELTKTASGKRAMEVVIFVRQVIQSILA